MPLISARFVTAWMKHWCTPVRGNVSSTQCLMLPAVHWNDINLGYQQQERSSPRR
jgi:hypothetical protein